MIGGSGSVFATDPALEWLRLLQALERPTARDRASLAALTCFVGWTPEGVATADEAEWEALHWSLHRWATLLRDQGVASLYQAVSSSHEVPERVLARPSGERFMTDLRHIAQLLHEAGVSEGLGPDRNGHLAGTADPRCGAGQRERGTGAAPRVRCRGGAGHHDPPQQGARVPDRVLPVHVGRSRPFNSSKRVHVPMFHDPANDSRAHHRRRARRERLRPVHQKMELEEGRGEDLRLLYVALTRARHQAVLWWAGAYDSQHSPLARLLFDRDAQGVVGPYGAKTRDDASIEATLIGLGPCVSVERVAVPSAQRWEQGNEVVPHLEAAIFDRTLDVRLAPGFLFEHHQRRARPASGRERTGAAADVRRGGARGAPGTGRRGSSVGRPRRRPAAGRHARRCTGGHGGPRRVRAHRVRRFRPGGRGQEGAGQRGGLAQCRTWATPRSSSRACAPPSRAHSGRWRTGAD